MISVTSAPPSFISEMLGICLIMLPFVLYVLYLIIKGEI